MGIGHNAYTWVDVLAISPEYKNEYVQEMESTMNDKAQLKSVTRGIVSSLVTPFPCSESRPDSRHAKGATERSLKS